MTSFTQPPLRVALACGGTGGHLFPGLAVAECLRQRGCEVTVLVSPKDIDQSAAKRISGMEVSTLPAIGLVRGQRLPFVRAFWRSYRLAVKYFRVKPPQGVLAMGGFTAAAPLLAGKRLGAATFLHESNTIPGRANRWMARLVDGAFVGFPAAANRLQNRSVKVTGTPVRPQFTTRDAVACRKALGLDPAKPVVLVMGGSQGAHAVNALVLRTLPLVAQFGLDWQWLHLTGPADEGSVVAAYAAAHLRAEVRAFLPEMELALGASNAAISRAGASSLAELAAMRLPAILVPYPAATDNHQFHNARAFAETGAALMLEQCGATPEALAPMLQRLVQDGAARSQVQQALAQWHAPDAAERIASSMLEMMSSAVLKTGPAQPASPANTSAPGVERRVTTVSLFST